MLPRINAAIGSIRLDRLQPHHLLAFYDNLAEAGIREDIKYKCTVDLKDHLKTLNLSKKAFTAIAGVSLSVLNSVTQGKNVTKESATRIGAALNLPMETLFEPVNADAALSDKTIQHHHRLVSSILETAVQWQVIFSNPCERVKPPKVEKSEPRYLDDKQTLQLLELLQNEEPQKRTMITLLLFTGLRRGELLGLEWPDIDFVHEVIHVRRSSLYLPDRGIFQDETKNSTSSRVIKAPAAVFSLLREFKTYQAEQRLKLGDRWMESARLFTASNGKPLHPDTLTGWFHDFVERSDLPSVCVHSMRHPYVKPTTKNIYILIFDCVNKERTISYNRLPKS